ncbi:hypothetical protein ACP70R_037172 [Stipagrostis hirtigluma subsp. patula]
MTGLPTRLLGAAGRLRQRRPSTHRGFSTTNANALEIKVVSIELLKKVYFKKDEGFRHYCELPKNKLKVQPEKDGSSGA